MVTLQPTTGGSQHVAPGPSPEDVTFGRACEAFGLVTREALLACVADQRRLGLHGRPVTLAQVMIGRQLINPEQYRRVAERIRQRTQELQQLQERQRQEALLPRGTPVPPAPPDITSSGRYWSPAQQQFKKKASDVLPADMTANVGAAQPLPWNEAPAPSDDELREAARTWDDASNQVSVSYEAVAAPLPGETAGATATGSQHVTTPQAARERKDTGIRKILGVPETAEEFDFGPYRILGEVASGGMGIIYRALAQDTGQVYALKALINVENASEKQLRRFIQEAQSAMRLDHPGIVRIHDLGIYENIPYFTMDLVDGEDLHHHLRHRTFGRDELLRIFMHTARAVHYAHEHGVIHRDLKPANIIVRRTDRFAVLTDFGLAKNLDSSFKLTAEGAMVGTPLFLSPEQVSGKAQDVDRRCDVYGLGVMLYQILTGKLPFIGRNPYEVYRKVLEEDPTPPTQVDPGVPPDLEKICLMALAKDREERYPTAEAMAADVERFLQGQPVEARLPTPAKVAAARVKPDPGASRRTSRRRRVPDQDAASTLTLAGIGVAVVVIVLALTYIGYSLLIVD